MKKLLSLLGCVAIVFLSGCGDTEVKRPYTEPELQEGQALIWLRTDGQGGHYQLLDCSEELSCTTRQYHFDNNPEGKGYCIYFACVVTGLSPTDSGEIILVFNNDSAPWINVKKTLIYDVTVSADGQVTLGEGEECQDFAVGYEFIAEPDKQFPEDPYSITAEDGSITLVSSYTVGTPYYYAGALWDPQILEHDRGGGMSGDNDSSTDGGGIADYKDRFIPKTKGETTIALLETYTTDDETTGYFYNITVDEDMRCRWNWYVSGIKDEDFTIYIMIKDRKYLFQ